MTDTALLDILRSVPDPEVPAISIVDLGIVRDVVRETGGGVRVDVTPTYSGCPAMQLIEREIRTALTARGEGPVTVRTVYQPAWTTDWMTDSARDTLRAYGIAPPGKAAVQELVPITPRRRTVACPFCGATDTELRSEFGSTACKALHVCHACRQPFEEFKAI